MSAKLIDVSEPVSLHNRFGPFELRSFLIDEHGRRDAHLAVTAAAPRDGDPLRITSGCLTGHVFGCRRCDCAWQLDQALRRLADEKRGLLTYHPPDEGRGVGLHHKLRAAAVMERDGVDGLAAHRALGLPGDARSFVPAVVIAIWFGLSRVRLLSGNPAKARALRDAGLRVDVQPWHDIAHDTRRAYGAWQERVLWPRTAYEPLGSLAPSSGPSDDDGGGGGGGGGELEVPDRAEKRR